MISRDRSNVIWRRNDENNGRARMPGCMDDIKCRPISKSPHLKSAVLRVVLPRRKVFGLANDNEKLPMKTGFYELKGPPALFGK